MIRQGLVADSFTLKEIDLLRQQHPYCSALQVLYAIGLSHNDNIQMKDQINLASIYVNDRAKLYQYTRKKQGSHSSAELNIDESTVAPQANIPALNSVSEVEPIQSPSANLLPSNKIGQQDDERPDIGSLPLESEPLLSELPLEKEVMSAALVQLGEIVVNESFQEIEHESTTISSDEREANTFGEWLLKIGNIESKQSESSKNEAILLEKFIQESPQITPVKKAFFSSVQLGKHSLVEDESLATETLAKIYERQGDYKRAARAYANLCLKYPEKSIYFAALQKQVEEKIKS